MYCEKCGAKVEKDANYCDVCGEVLKENTSGKINKFMFVDEDKLKQEEIELLDEEKPSKRKKWIFIIPVIIIIIAVIVLAALEIYRKVEGNNNGIVSNVLTEKDLAKAEEDWTVGIFNLGGVNYSLNSSYKNFEKNNWKIPDQESTYNNFSLIKNDKTSVSISLNNSNYDSNVKIGIINLKDEKREINDCEVWGITVNNENATKPVEFVLSKGIKNGSTKEDIIKAYGELPEEKIKVLDDRIILQYQKDYSVYLDLTVINDKGLEAFSYKKY